MFSRRKALLLASLLGPGAAMASPPAGQALNPHRVQVPGGTFKMGSEGGATDERPVHSVQLDAFQIDRTEVTNAEYQRCVTAGVCKAPAITSSKLRRSYFGDARFADYPVVFVDHAMATAYCSFAGGRLPTEAEWELAARGAADSRAFPWGAAAPSCALANFAGCVGDTDRVGVRPQGASPYGALDMAGNVWEWTSDWYDPAYYRNSAAREPKGPMTGTLKVMRGGCWMSGVDSLRSTCRKPELPSTWAYNVGIRCVYPSSRS